MVAGTQSTGREKVHLAGEWACYPRGDWKAKGRIEWLRLSISRSWAEGLPG